MNRAQPCGFIIDLMRNRALRANLSGDAETGIETFTALGACLTCGSDVRYPFWPGLAYGMGTSAHCLNCGQVELDKTASEDFPGWRRPAS